MKTYQILAVAAALATLSANASEPTSSTTAQWQLEGNDSTSYTHKFVISGDLSFDELGFNTFARKMTPTDPRDTIVEVVPGYYLIRSDKFGPGRNGTAEIEIVTKGSFANRCYAPDGLHRVDKKDGKPLTTAIPLECGSITQNKKQWVTPGRNDKMPYGPEVYARNEELRKGSRTPDVFSITPSFKSVKRTGGTSRLPLAVKYTYRAQENPEAYTVVIARDTMHIIAADEIQASLVKNIMDKKVLANVKGKKIDNVVIDDAPDFPYRGVMIDISRNYQTPRTMASILDLMALYRLNTLHFHFADDEAWRLEIPGLPELTDYASRRGYTTDENDYLVQIFAGDGNPDSKEGSANGYFTREDFIKMLQHAQSLGIRVIPEIESPGHIRAAIKAMENRYRRTGDDFYRLIHDGDTSTYTSAQSFHDNVLNPALEGPYHFLDKVYTEIQRMYHDAGVELPAIHIGGDEVAKGGWNGSQVAKDFIAKHDLKDEKGLHGYFIDRISDMLSSKGIKMSGWQEIAVGYSPEFEAKIAPRTYSVNSWTLDSHNNNGITRRAVNAGFPVVLSNVNHFYMDMCYSSHPDEPGLIWGGAVDEFDSLHGYPNVLCPQQPGDKGQVVGIQGQLFAETMRTAPQLEMYLLPKMLGMVERAWNADTTYTDAEFNSLIYAREIPGWERDGRNYHVRQPGIMVKDGKIYMNTPYPNAQVRYTLDGSEPTAESPLYTKPLSAKQMPKEVRARMFVNGKPSVTTILYIE